MRLHCILNVTISIASMHSRHLFSLLVPLYSHIHRELYTASGPSSQSTLHYGSILMISYFCDTAYRLKEFRGWPAFTFYSYMRISWFQWPFKITFSWLYCGHLVNDITQHISRTVIESLLRSRNKNLRSFYKFAMRSLSTASQPFRRYTRSE